MLVEAAVWEIAVCSTCRKQSECFDKKDVAELTCYICNWTFCDISL